MTEKETEIPTIKTKLYRNFHMHSAGKFHELAQGAIDYIADLKRFKDAGGKLFYEYLKEYREKFPGVGNGNVGGGYPGIVGLAEDAGEPFKSTVKSLDEFLDEKIGPNWVFAGITHLRMSRLHWLGINGDKVAFEAYLLPKSLEEYNNWKKEYKKHNKEYWRQEALPVNERKKDYYIAPKEPEKLRGIFEVTHNPGDKWNWRKITSGFKVSMYRKDEPKVPEVFQSIIFGQSIPTGWLRREFLSKYQKGLPMKVISEVEFEGGGFPVSLEKIIE